MNCFVGQGIAEKKFRRLCMGRRFKLGGTISGDWTEHLKKLYDRVPWKTQGEGGALFNFRARRGMCKHFEVSRPVSCGAFIRRDEFPSLR